MTVYEEDVEARRPSGVGTKVLVLACAILAILGSFWGIVWFIRAYVEPPRVMMPAPLVLAARESVPAPAPPPRAEARAAEIPPPVIAAQAAPALPAPALSAPLPSVPPPAAARNADPSPANPIADRFGSMDQFAPSAAPPAPAPPPAAAPVESAPAALAATAPDPDEVVEGSVPAIDGPPPLPRRKPIVTAAKRTDPPLPRPRPETAAQPSVWTAVPTTDDRFPQQ